MGTQNGNPMKPVIHRSLHYMDARPSVRNISASILQKKKEKKENENRELYQNKKSFPSKKTDLKMPIHLGWEHWQFFKKRKAKNIFIIYGSRKLEKIKKICYSTII